MKNETSNRWCFTSWDFNTLMAFYNNKRHLIRCMVVGKEICPSTEKLHFQGYIEFVKSYNLSSVKRIWLDRETHFEIAREDRNVCIAYCSKQNDLIINFGIIETFYKENWKDILDDVFDLKTV